MEFRKKLSFREQSVCVAVLVWASLIYGLFLYAGLKEGSWSLRKGDTFGFVLLGLAGAMCFRALLRSDRLIINRSHQTVAHVTGWIWRRHHKKFGLSEFDCVGLAREQSVVKGKHKHFYVVILTGPCEGFSLDASDDFEQARNLAVELANFIGVQFADFSTGKAIVRAPGMLTRPLTKLPGRAREGIDKAEKPDDLSASYQEEDGKLVIDIPRAGMTFGDWLPILVFYAISLSCLSFGIYLFVRSLPDGELVSLLFIVLVVILWVVTTTTFSIMLSLKLAFQCARVVISPASLEVSRRSLFRTKSLSIAAEELIEIEVIERHPPLWRWLLNVIPATSELAIISETGMVCFGGGLTIAELQWMHAEICRRLLMV